MHWQISKVNTPKHAELHERLLVNPQGVSSDRYTCICEVVVINQ